MRSIPQINSERLADLFIRLCEIDSPSGREGRLARFIKHQLDELNCEIIEDDSAVATGSDTGNLLCRPPEGGLDLEPVFFNCHLDTVMPAEGVRVKREGDLFRSAGDTVLGGDDKSGIAVLIEVLRTLRETGTPYGPVELLFTTCEEIGLLGAKALDPALLATGRGYALDTTGNDRLIVGAPAANRFRIEISGLAAHAGLHPEKGINAIQLAASAIASLTLGRLDGESTANIGRIEGGTATNIVPAWAVINGEVRSHSEALLSSHTDAILNAFHEAVDHWHDPVGQVTGRPSLKVRVSEEYPVMKLSISDPVVARATEAAGRLGRNLTCEIAGGGSDANIFNSYGLPCAILSTGMQGVHTVDETINLQDMVQTAELILAMLTR